jgi:hypothetical protein
MVGRSAQHTSKHDNTSLHDLLDHMEPDLRLLEGTVSILRSLSETSDAVEPVALETIAHLAGETVERLTLRWRAACNILRGRWVDGDELLRKARRDGPHIYHSPRPKINSDNRLFEKVCSRAGLPCRTER